MCAIKETGLTIPNIITIIRLLLVPATVWALLTHNYDLAFGFFLIAGISDGVDGFIARQFNQMSELGAYLDPVADKLLLVSVFVVLAILGQLPLWLVVIAVSRDALILLAVMLSTVMGRPVTIRPSLASKANTAVQIVLVVIVLADLAFSLDLGTVREALAPLSVLLTVVSGAAYLVVWLRHMADHG